MLQKVLSFIAPPSCVGCATEGSVLCEMCEASLVRKVPSCVFCNRLEPGGRSCKNCYRKFKLRGASVLWRYEGLAKDLVHALKYQNDRTVAKRVVHGMIEVVDAKDFDAVMAVPSDGASLRRRGYNQAELLARAVAQSCSLPCLAPLIRTRHTQQARLTRSQRLEVVKGNFVCRAPSLITGKKLLLVDDVITTGATAGECARVLMGGGAQQVWALAIAKK